MVHITHHMCGKCKISPVCNFAGNPRLAVGEVIANPHVSQSNPEVCSRYRCEMGEHRALSNARAAAQGKLSWELRVVNGVKTPVLDVTTEKKSGFLGSEGEFITEDGGKLMRTGQKLKPKQIEQIRKHIATGIEKSGISV